VLMPQYEFICNSCKKFFSKSLTLAEYEEGKIVCPYCESDDVERRWNSLHLVRPKKSA
jgi:putative FmdB family regulatory protein